MSLKPDKMKNKINYPVSEADTLREDTLSEAIGNITDEICENAFFMANNIIEKISELKHTQLTYPLIPFILYILLSTALFGIFMYVICKLLKGDPKQTDEEKTLLVHKLSSMVDPSQAQNETCLNILKKKPSLINDCMMPHNYTPFLRACWSGNTYLVEYMLRNGADITLKPSSKDTPIYLASYRATKSPDKWDPALLDLLYKAGCSVNTTNAHGHTPLILAARAGHVTLTRWLLIHGADPSLNASLSPYELAVSYGDSCHQSIAALLHLHITMSDKIDYNHYKPK